MNRQRVNNRCKSELWTASQAEHLKVSPQNMWKNNLNILLKESSASNDKKFQILYSFSPKTRLHLVFSY